VRSIETVSRVKNHNDEPRPIANPLDESKPAPALALARELVFAIESAPQTIGRTATHYFSWVEELIGKKRVPFVAPFLDSIDPLVRYQAAWWLSFRQVDATVMNELKYAEKDESIEEWARSGARGTLVQAFLQDSQSLLRGEFRTQ
jgi:hypothetical protein